MPPTRFSAKIKEQPPAPEQWRVRAILAGSAGNLVEWYDWYVYAAFSLYFAGSFFPGKNNTVQLINTAGIFAVGFLMRPLGGYLFGRLADKNGRKKSMAVAVLMMAMGSLLIGLLPGYRQIGIAAPLLLLAARMLQGLSTGGEYGASATYLSETAVEGRRGFYSSFQYVTLIGGQLLAIAVQLILQLFLLTEKQLQEWGWRIPFLLGAVLSLVAYLLRKKMPESDAFQQETTEKRRRGSLRELARHPKAVMTVFGLTLGGTLAFYTYTTYMQKFLVNTAGMSRHQSTFLLFLALLLFAAIQPLFGWISDKVGRKPLLIGFGVAGTLFTVPLLEQLSHTHQAAPAFLLMVTALVIVSGYTSINAVVKAELFPVNIRTLGVGLPYSITVAVFGGTAEYIALWCKQAGMEKAFYWYVSSCIFLSLIMYVFMKDRSRSSWLDKKL